MPTIITLSLQLSVAGVLIVSAITKLGSTANEETWQTLLGRPSRRFWPRMLSWGHILTEFAIGAALLLGPTLRVSVLPALDTPAALATLAALAAATLLMASFTILAAYSAWSGRRILCSCFGRSTTSLGWPHTARNLALTTMAALALVGTAPLPQGARTDTAEIALSIAVALVVTLASAFMDDIVHLLRANARAAGRGQTPRSI